MKVVLFFVLCSLFFVLCSLFFVLCSSFLLLLFVVLFFFSFSFFLLLFFLLLSFFFFIAVLFSSSLLTAFRTPQVGDIVEVVRDGESPADLLLLASSSEDGVCYVSTMNLDGETSLKARRVLRVNKSG